MLRARTDLSSRVQQGHGLSDSMMTLRRKCYFEIWRQSFQRMSRVKPRNTGDSQTFEQFGQGAQPGIRLFRTGCSESQSSDLSTPGGLTSDCLNLFRQTASREAT